MMHAAIKLVAGRDRATSHSVEYDKRRSGRAFHNPLSLTCDGTTVVLPRMVHAWPDGSNNVMRTTSNAMIDDKKLLRRPFDPLCSIAAFGSDQISQRHSEEK